MFAFRNFLALTLVSLACANASILGVRQTNTNAAINSAVDSLDTTVRQTASTIDTLQASEKMSTSTLRAQMTTIETAFTKLDKTLAATGVSAGSTTVAPTNDDIGITLSDAMQLVATSLSGVIPSGAVPGFPTMVATLDPIMSKALAQFNTTSPNGIALVHIMMLDASQFLRDEGFTLTLTTLGF
ncbi:POXA3a laccase small subunit [Mycena galericulata]|nr:POXA3a laccase small subunit [Mycena galericulata]